MSAIRKSAFSASDMAQNKPSHVCVLWDLDQITSHNNNTLSLPP
jgi:hypothetical protein